MSWFKTFNSKQKTQQKAQKDSFPTEIVENADLNKPVKQNNNHTRIMRKIRFRSSFKDVCVRWESYGSGCT